MGLFFLFYFLLCAQEPLSSAPALTLSRLEVFGLFSVAGEPRRSQTGADRVRCRSLSLANLKHSNVIVAQRALLECIASYTLRMWNETWTPAPSGHAVVPWLPLQALLSSAGVLLRGVFSVQLYPTAGSFQLNELFPHS